MAIHRQSAAILARKISLKQASADSDLVGIEQINSAPASVRLIADKPAIHHPHTRIDHPNGPAVILPVFLAPCPAILKKAVP